MAQATPTLVIPTIFRETWRLESNKEELFLFQVLLHSAPCLSNKSILEQIVLHSSEIKPGTRADQVNYEVTTEVSCIFKADLACGQNSFPPGI